MTINADFEEFIKRINPSETTICEISRLHKTLRAFLKQSEIYQSVFDSSYLSGSYAKHTFIRPKNDISNSDIDIIVETKHTTSDSPNSVLQHLKDALDQNHNYRNSKIQNHSIGIEMANFHIDVVPLVRGLDNEYYIGSIEQGSWRLTRPKGHIQWATHVNKNFANTFKPIIKVFKWWRQEHCNEEAKLPKGITLEKMIADNLPDAGLPIQEAVMHVMSNLAVAYENDLELGVVPFVEDPSIKGASLTPKYSYSDFAAFKELLDKHIGILAEKGNTNEAWQDILGKVFPPGNDSVNEKDFALNENLRTNAYSVTHKEKLGFPIQAKKPNATITATATLPDGSSVELNNDGEILPKGASIIYRVNCGPVKNSYVKWRITNTGDEAMSVCPRGGFEKPNEGKTSRREETAYTGKHFVECFVIRQNVCIRWSKPFFINVE